MIDPAILPVFLLAILALFLSPGPNMAFVLSHAVAHGPRGGLAAALGIGAADLLHTLFAATGITALAAAWPPSFDVIRYLGALYLLWLAAQAVLAPGQALVGKAASNSMLRVFRMSMLNCLLNPKALLFFMVFLPQFVDPARGHVPFQVAALGVILAATVVLLNLLLGACAAPVGRFLGRHPNASKYQSWMLAWVMAALALRLLMLERPSAR